MRRPLLPALLLACLWAGTATAEPARTCLRHGPGFVEVPGTTTCIRIGGRVRAEYGTASRRIAREDIRDGVSGSRASGTVSLDGRTDTAYGPVRGFVRLRAGQDGRRWDR